MRAWVAAHRPLCAGLLAAALHLPFVIRYDLHFQPDFAISVLISKSVLDGEWPVFFWGQGFLGTYGNYLTAVLFRVFGVSVPLAGLVSLAIWASGVALATALAERLLGVRAAVWTALAAAVASPYANHYVTQPYASYETAPVLALLVLGGLLVSARLVGSPLGPRAAATWVALGLLLGLGWWTTRLFLPALGAAALAVALCGIRSGPAVRRAAAGIALMVPGVLVGASPDVLTRLGVIARDASAWQLGAGYEFEPAALSTIPANAREALRALPAYFNGSALARLPEGMTFIRAVARGKEPYTDPALAPGTAGRLHDAAIGLLIAAVLLAAVPTGVRAWRRRDPALLALCLVPFVAFGLIAVSGRTAGGYYEARRYWFGTLLVFPLLVGNAMALAGGTRAAGACKVLAGLFLASSLVAQARMLAFPDELAEFRVLVPDLVAAGERGVVMPRDAFVFSALSGGVVDAVTPNVIRWRPRLAERVAARPHIVVAVPADRELPRGGVALLGRHFREDGDPHDAGAWRWRRFSAAP